MSDILILLIRHLLFGWTIYLLFTVHKGFEVRSKLTRTGQLVLITWMLFGFYTGKLIYSMLGLHSGLLLFSLLGLYATGAAIGIILFATIGRFLVLLIGPNGSGAIASSGFLVLYYALRRGLGDHSDHMRPYLTTKALMYSGLAILICLIWCLLSYLLFRLRQKKYKFNHPAPRLKKKLWLKLVVSLVALLLFMAIPIVSCWSDIQDKGQKRYKIFCIRHHFMNFSSALDLYKLDYGSYPSSEEGLIVLKNPPGGKKASHMNSIPKDPWGNEYRYFSHETEYSGFNIISTGSDGKLGGGDDISMEDILWNNDL